MELRKGVTETEYGNFPIGWDFIKIQKLIDTKIIVDHLDGNHGSLYPRSNEFQDDGVPYISATDFLNGVVDFKNCKHLSFERAKLFQKGFAKNGDILFAHNATVGPVAMLESNLDYIILSTTATYYRCDNKLLLNIYLKYALQAQYFVRQYQSVMSQSTRFQVPITAQRKFSIALPTKAEQTAIASALSDADVYINSLEKLIEKKRNIKQGAMQQLLKPKEGWVETTLGEILDLIADYTANGSFESLKNMVTYYSDTNYAVLVRTTDLDKAIFVPQRFTDKKGYKYLSKTSLYGGEIVIANVGSLGKVFRVPKFDSPMTLAPNTYLLKFNKSISEDFIFQWLTTKEFYSKLLSKIGSTTLQAINKDSLRSIALSVPNNLDEQKEISTILSDMDNEITSLEKKLSKSKMLKQGMMQELLTGKIRLV